MITWGGPGANQHNKKKKNARVGENDTEVAYDVAGGGRGNGRKKKEKGQCDLRLLGGREAGKIKSSSGATPTSRGPRKDPEKNPKGVTGGPWNERRKIGRERVKWEGGEIRRGQRISEEMGESPS